MKEEAPFRLGTDPFRQDLAKSLGSYTAHSIRTAHKRFASAEALLHFEPYVAREGGEGQWPFFQSHAKGRDTCAWCGNRWGKSTIAAVLMCMHAYRIVPFALRQLFPPEAVAKWPQAGLYWIVVPDFPQSLDAIKERMEAYLPKGRYRFNDNDKSWYCDTGSIIRLKSCETELRKFEGAAIDGALFDEEPDGEEYFNAVLMRLLSKKGWWAMTLTPIRGVTWAYDKIFELRQPNLDIVRGTIWDNPYLDRASIARTLATYPAYEREARELGNAIAMSGQNFFDPFRLQVLFRRKKVPTLSYSLDGLGLRHLDSLPPDDVSSLAIYEKPKPGKAYILAADVSAGGLDADWSVAQILDADSCNLVASYHGRVSPELFGARILPLLGRLYREAMVVVESNSYGLQTIDALRKSGYSRIYMERDLRHIGATIAPRYGFHMNAQTRPLVLGRLEQRVRMDTIEIPHARTLREMTRFVRAKDGRFQGAGGYRDDEVMSLAIGVFVATTLKVLPREERTEGAYEWDPEEDALFPVVGY